MFVFLVCGPGETDALGLNGLGRAVWALADIAALVALLGVPRPVLRNLADNLVLLAWPALAIASSLWSLTPSISLYQGLQLLMTLLIGYVAAALAGLRETLVAVGVGLGLATLASIALIALRPGLAIGDDGTWIGAFTHKNQMGGFMALAAITGVALIADGRYRILGLALVIPALVLAVESRSGTSLLALVAALCPIPLAWAYRRGVAAFGIAIGLLLGGTGVMLSIAIGDGGGVVDAVLGGLGKDATLTGRTVLWQFGLDQIHQSPLLGVGYKAYWESPLTSAAYLRYVVGQDLWFFHNNFIDVTVAFGVVGLVTFTLGLVVALWRTIAMFRARPTAIEAWRVMFMLFVIVEATAENPLFQNHSLLQLLFAVAVARPRNDPAPDPRPLWAVRHPLRMEGGRP